ncbi:MAG: SRPBCC family protein [Chloroflexota bacterium]
MASLDLKLAINIQAPPQRVYNLLTDIPRIPALFEGFHDVRNFHGGDVAEGDTFTVVTSFMGREILNEYTVTELESPSILAWDALSPQAKVNSKFTIADYEGGSRVILHVVGNPRGLVASIGMGMIEANLKEGIIRDLKNIRAILEAE